MSVNLLQEAFPEKICRKIAFGRAVACTGVISKVPNQLPECFSPFSTRQRILGLVSLAVAECRSRTPIFPPREIYLGTPLSGNVHITFLLIIVVLFRILNMLLFYQFHLVLFRK